MSRIRNRREFIRSAALGGLAAGMFPGILFSKTAYAKEGGMEGMNGKRPNILFITNDQQSSTMMSCAGNTYVKTPAMDRLAAEGMRFNRAYCTNPVCLPSRFSWYTGRRPSAIDVFSNKDGRKATIPQDIHNSTMPLLLKQAGYRVAYGGKTHLPGDITPENMGCEFLTGNKREGLVAASSAWLKERGQKQDGPFFLAVNLVNPHDICHFAMRKFYKAEMADKPNLNKNERFLLDDTTKEGKLMKKVSTIPDGMTEEEFYADICPPLPPNHAPQADEPEAVTAFTGSMPVRRYYRSEKWSDRDWRMHRWAYARLTEVVDREIGMVLDALDDAGLAENTVVIFTSDHGDHDSAHCLDQKTVMYDEAARIPLLMRWPGKIKPGQVNDMHTVSNGLDILPTMCAIAGCAVPDGMEGSSLLPLTAGAADVPFRKATPLECQIGRGVVLGEYKYLQYNDGANREQLMDLAKDPGETRNHLNDPANAEVLQACRDAYNRYFNA